MSERKKCIDCVHCINEKFQLLKCARKKETLFDGTKVFAFCQDERHYDIGQCGEEGKFFKPKTEAQVS